MVSEDKGGVKQRLKALGIRPADMARACHISEGTLSLYLNGKREMPPARRLLFELWLEKKERELAEAKKRGRVLLMNSSMMPKPGTYTLREISKREFMQAVREANKTGLLKSFIGYEQNSQYIRKESGVPVETNRGIADPKPGDELLIMKLDYRPGVKEKGAKVDESRFRFFRCTYQILD